MYRILGADQQEYGPASAEQIRQWIVERRLNANTLARTEESTGWKPLSFFPEFSATLQAAAPVLPVTASDEPLNALGVTGFVCGLLSIVCCCSGPLLAVLGIAFSTIGLVQINKTQLKRGKQLAVAGIVLGGIGMLEFLALLAGGQLAELLRLVQ